MKYWLFKTEPSTYSIEHLKQRPQQVDSWDGVRNYQARNFLRDECRNGDLCFLYHSSCAEPGIVGTMKVIREAYPDVSALDPKDHHFDPLSTPDNPRWYAVDVKLQDIFSTPILLETLRQHEALANMRILQKGNRLSITPVTKDEWTIILRLPH